MYKILQKAIAPFLFFLALLILWEGGTWLFDPPTFLLPAPSDIWAAGREVDARTWLTHCWSTVRVALIGFTVAIAVSLPLSIGLAVSPLMSRTVYPLLVLIQSTPVVAVAPIIVVALGAGDLPRVVITAMIAFFPLVVSTTTGLLRTPQELVELSRSLSAPRHREIFQIRMMCAMPYIFSALKISITLSIIGAVVAEFVAAENGLGYFILYSTSFFKVPQAFAALALLITVSLTLFFGIVLVQRAFFGWSVNADR